MVGRNELAASVTCYDRTLGAECEYPCITELAADRDGIHSGAQIFNFPTAIEGSFHFVHDNNVAQSEMLLVDFFCRSGVQNDLAVEVFGDLHDIQVGIRCDLILKNDDP